VSTHGL